MVCFVTIPIACWHFAEAVNFRILTFEDPCWPDVEQLLQDYLRELAPWSGARPNKRGRYQYPYLNHYRTDPDREMLVLQNNLAAEHPG